VKKIVISGSKNDITGGVFRPLFLAFRRGGLVVSPDRRTFEKLTDNFSEK
jgi:hypothetical protein